QQERADSPGPSCVSMKSDWSMKHPPDLKDGNNQPSKKRKRQERADAPGPSCVSMKSDWEERAYGQSPPRLRSEATKRLLPVVAFIIPASNATKMDHLPGVGQLRRLLKCLNTMLRN
ncbi:unnamed protein product, partial [Lota lota]